MKYIFFRMKRQRDNIILAAMEDSVYNEWIKNPPEQRSFNFTTLFTSKQKLSSGTTVINLDECREVYTVKIYSTLEQAMKTNFVDLL